MEARGGDADVLHEAHRVVDEPEQRERVEAPEELARPRSCPRERRSHDEEEEELPAAFPLGCAPQHPREHGERREDGADHALHQPARFANSKTSRMIAIPFEAVARSIVNAGWSRTRGAYAIESSPRFTHSS